MIYKTYISVDERIAHWDGFVPALKKIEAYFNSVALPIKMMIDEIEVLPVGYTNNSSGDMVDIYKQWKEESLLKKRVGLTPNTFVLFLPYYVPVQQDNHPNGITAGREYKFGNCYAEMVQDIYTTLSRRPQFLRKIEHDYNPSEKESWLFRQLVSHELGHAFGAHHDGYFDPKVNEIVGTDRLSIMIGTMMPIESEDMIAFSKKSLKEMEGFMEFKNKPGSVYWRPEENWQPKIASRKIDSDRFDDIYNFVIGRFSRATYPNGNEKPYHWVDSITGKTINTRDKVQICLDIFGAVLPEDAQELFYQCHADVLKYLAPKIGWPMPLNNSNILAQGVCQNKYGLLDTFDEVVRGTYNAGMNEKLVSKQGFRHNGNDIQADLFYFFDENKNLLINPFPDGMPVKAVRNTDGQEDRDGAAVDWGKSGNVYELHAFLNGDVNNFAPWNSMSIVFVHCKKNSWRLDKDEDIITKFGTVIGQIGCSGYSALGSIHSHTEFLLSREIFNPFYGKNSFFLKAPIFRDQEGLLNVIDYPTVSRERSYKNLDTGEQELVKVFPRDYKNSGGFSYGLRVQVDDGDMCNACSITPGTHKYVFESNVEISEIWFDRNPWGEWKPCERSDWWKWIKQKLHLEAPPSRNLMDYSTTEPEFDTYEKIYAYEDPETLLLYKSPEDAKKVGVNKVNPKSVILHSCTLTIPSKVPDDAKGYGVYTYYALFKNARTNRVVLKLDKEA